MDAKTEPAKKLKVGLLLNSTSVPRWVRVMLERVVALPCAEVAVLVMDETPREKTPFGILRQLFSSRLLYLIYNRVDQRFTRLTPDAFEMVLIDDLVDGVPRVPTRPARSKFTDQLSDDELAKVAQHEPDLLLRLGFRILKGGVLEAATYGIWSFHHGDNRINRGGPPGFWEVFEDHPVTGVVLQILNEHLDGGLVLSRAWCATDHLSVQRNKNGLFWSALSLVPQQIERLHRMGGEAFLAAARTRNSGPAFYADRLYREPSNRQLAGPLVSHLWRSFRERVRNRFAVESWSLRYTTVGGEDRLRRYKTLAAPPDRFWADPHVLERDGRWFIFVEDWKHREGRGHISVIEMDEDGNIEGTRTALERPYHLSYPFVFRWNDEDFMVPETVANRTVELYRCVEFPHRWEPYRTLMQDVDAVDATLFEHRGRWWMFVARRPAPGASVHDALELYSAPRPDSENWVAHPQSPIVTDVRRARPAGAIFEQDGRLYRPGQDCAHEYGHAIVLNEIVTLTATEYEERPVQRLAPDWDPSLTGMHTIARAGRLTMIDVKERRSRSAVARAIRRG